VAEHQSYPPSKVYYHPGPPAFGYFYHLYFMMGNGLGAGQNYVSPFTERLPIGYGLQIIGLQSPYLKPLKEELFYLVVVEQFIQPVYQELLQVKCAESDGPFHPLLYPGQVSNDVKEGKGGITKEFLKENGFL